ncbi:hypothetical protein QBC46DRAFT_253952 [Diplogelasinospora grovesii]|uniref:Uncharacterized protein n=1 Tax=Diplogelasinospora grovesii TaxID=303347 RepID=A0AAN6NCZ6_9PEZI|nr:hypothetical protein QBC46DRAFT_253952 [Diplogelasinospora grovesii]
MARSLMKYIYISLGLLAIDAAISMGLVTRMVVFLHFWGAGPFEIANPPGTTPSTYMLNGHPAGLLVDQGHTTNGAGGTALVLVGFGGILALWLEHRSRTKHGKSSPVFYVWAITVVLSWLLTLTALIYTYVVTAMTQNQSIDPAVAVQNAGQPYPDDWWTPETWYTAVLGLTLSNESDYDLIRNNLRLMRGWRYNLIPLFILGFILMDLVILEVLRTRKAGAKGGYGRAPSGEHHQIEKDNKGQMDAAQHPLNA